MTKEGKVRRYRLFKLKNWTPPKPKEYVDKLPAIGIILRTSRSTLQQRLEANVCEFCEREGGYFEVHHIRKLKDVKGKGTWEQLMIAMKRKTMILCNECHDLLHAGKLSHKRKKV